MGPGPKFPQSGSSVTLGLLSDSVNASGEEQKASGGATAIPGVPAQAPG